jgi:hypothetical protein
MEKMKNICKFIAYSKFKKYQSKKQEPNVKEKKLKRLIKNLEGLVLNLRRREKKKKNKWSLVSNL